MAAKLHYLTVQDMLSINLQVTKKVNSYQYATLEEATYYQYAYGDSDELLDQAARFLTGFMKKSPMSAGNEATAFVGCIAFLMLNGTSLAVDDAGALQMFRRAQSGSAKEALASAAHTDEHHHEGDSHTRMRSLMIEITRAFPNTIAELAGQKIAIAADAAIH